MKGGEKMKEVITPFAMRFQERIPEEEVVKVEGGYDQKSQTWKPLKSGDSSVTATFPQTERPPTVCTVPTRITPTITKTDRGVDD